ncbi:hypothetical protein E3N88_45938 [Mikania micrantha]|uniref:DC1 domain-containing protein n=1 Tax=Mikania micrantha TaxID=192012 RepID=A0A5N6L808_9ASTR|nr:hypothetical protein E3N88_45938 [Mikania micrantha]
MENSIDAKDQLDHFSHRHPLRFIVYLQQKNENDSDEDEDRDEEAEDEFVEENLHGGECNMCKEQILSFDVCYYYCKPCDYSLHKFCAEQPEYFQNHRLHPQHELSLYEPDDYGEFRCIICNLDQRNMYFYRCHTCYIFIDINCATSRERKINHPSHPHLLMELMPQPIVSSCSACEIAHDAHPGHLLYKIDSCEEYCKACYYGMEDSYTAANLLQIYIHFSANLLTFRFPFHETDSNLPPLTLSILDKKYGPKPFKSFSSWMRKPDVKIGIEITLKLVCSSGPPDLVLLDKLKRIKWGLKSWWASQVDSENSQVNALNLECNHFESLAKLGILLEDEKEKWAETRKQE